MLNGWLKGGYAPSLISVIDPKPLQAAVVKSDGGERCRNAGTMIPAGTVEGGERKQTTAEASKAD